VFKVLNLLNGYTCFKVMKQQPHEFRNPCQELFNEKECCSSKNFNDAKPWHIVQSYDK